MKMQSASRQVTILKIIHCLRFKEADLVMQRQKDNWEDEVAESKLNYFD